MVAVRDGEVHCFCRCCLRCLCVSTSSIALVSDALAMFAETPRVGQLVAVDLETGVGVVLAWAWRNPMSMFMAMAADSRMLAVRGYGSLHVYNMPDVQAIRCFAQRHGSAAALTALEASAFVSALSRISCFRPTQPAGGSLRPGQHCIASVSGG